MRATEARQAAGAGKRAKLTKAEQEYKDHKKAMAKAIREGKAIGKADMADVYKKIKQACNDGEEETSYKASGYKRREDRFGWDGGPDCARAGATAQSIANKLKKEGYQAKVRTDYDDTWDPDCGDMSYYYVYVDISWGKEDKE